MLPALKWYEMNDIYFTDTLKELHTSPVHSRKSRQKAFLEMYSSVLKQMFLLAYSEVKINKIR
jgi:hypothetical protein